MQSVAEAAAYLEQLINVEKRPELAYARLGLGPIRELLGRLGDPQVGLRAIHIAGSKGKGSTALFAEAICTAAGERVGTFTSPHLERWTERFRLAGAEAPEELLVAAVAALRPHVDAMRRTTPANAPTFFDATTAAALWIFREAAVDRAVLEVGLGGRLDSTNIVTPAVSCITSIELEHTDKLGDSLAAIAAEKAGILKPGVPAVAGELPDAARDVVTERARAVGTGVAWLGRDFEAAARHSGPDGLALSLRDGPVEVETTAPVLGEHQAANAGLALACVRRARAVPDAELGAVAARGLARASLPGRVEVFGRGPWVVIDTAHTAVSARTLAAALRALPRRRMHLVLSISAGKDLKSILAALVPHADIVTATFSEPARSLSPAEIAQAVRELAPELSLRADPDPRAALLAARADLASDDLLCVTGSVYLAGIARSVLRATAPAGVVAPAVPGEVARGEP